MFEILKNLHIDWKDRRLLQDLYMRQEAVVRVADGMSDPGIVGQGVRQGCPLSPLLFSIYAEVMMIEAMENNEEGIEVGGQVLSDIRFADDQAMASSTEKGLQNIMNNLNDTAKKFNMKINVQKTKTMVVSRKGGGFVNITIDGQRVEQVKYFKYLGSIITEDGRSLTDIKTRIALAKDAFNKRKELLTRELSKTLKKRMVKVLIWPVVLYGCETWTLRSDEIDKLQALEMWIWRRLERVSWMEKITNEEVLTMVNETRCLMRTIFKRKKNWMGHVLRGEGLLRDVLEGRMLGKRPRGRPRIGMLEEIMEGSFEKMKRRAEGREEWRNWVPRTCLRAEYL
jgi:DNA-binding protein YbaB